MTAQDLADAVAARRTELGLPWDLTRFGGPSEMTVRNIQAGHGEKMRSTTFERLDLALAWAPSSARRVLASGRQPTPIDDPEVVPRDDRGRRSPQLGVGGLDSEDGRALRIGRLVMALAAELHLEFGSLP